MLVKIGKGIELDVDTSKFNGAVTDHVMYMGLRNILMDSHANHTSDKEDYIEKSRETAEAKLVSLYEGNVRAAGERSGDPIKVQMRVLAQKNAKDAWKASGRKLRDITSEWLTNATNKLLEKNEAAYRKTAEKMVADAKALEVDLSGVGV